MCPRLIFVIALTERNKVNDFRVSLACVADKLNPSIVRLRISDQKLVLPPRVLPGFSIIDSNWLLHMAVLSCTVIRRVDLMVPWLHSRWIPDTQHKHGGGHGISVEAVKSSSNHLTVFLSNGNLRRFSGGNNVFVNLPTSFGKSFIFYCLPIVADVVHSKPKHAYMTNA